VGPLSARACRARTCPEEDLRRWAAEKVEAAERNGRSALPFQDSDLRD
jgi:hypothetical protein